MAGRYLCPMWCEKMKKIELTYENYISNEEIKFGDIFHGIYEVVSKPKITKAGYEWKIHHRRWDVELRMIRPDPSVYLAMDELEQSGIVSEYQRYFIPMQLHPYIEAFYDVRHIGGSAALFTEWSSRGTLAECMANGSLYRTDGDDEDHYILVNRLLLIAKQIARALQFMEEQEIYHGEVNAKNIMLNYRNVSYPFVAKLSLANLLTKRREPPSWSDQKQWARTMVDMLTGQKIYDYLTEIYRSEKKDTIVSSQLLSTICGVLDGDLTDWKDIMVGLGDEPEEDFYITRGGSLIKYEGYLNNFALRLADAGKKEDALRALDEARGGKQDYYFGFAAFADKNYRLLKADCRMPLRLFRENHY